MREDDSDLRKRQKTDDDEPGLLDVEPRSLTAKCKLGMLSDPLVVQDAGYMLDNSVFPWKSTSVGRELEPLHRVAYAPIKSIFEEADCVTRGHKGVYLTIRSDNTINATGLWPPSTPCLECKYLYRSRYMRPDLILGVGLGLWDLAR